MTKLSKLAVLALSAAATFAGSNVSAADTHSDASVVVSGYQLIDLDPTDGITPDIAFFGTRNYLENRINNTSNYGASTVETLSTTNANPLGSNLSLPRVNSVVANGGGQFGSLSTAATLTGNAQYSTIASLNTGFVITPKTLLVLFGHASANRSISATDGTQQAYTTAEMSLTGGLMGNNIGFQSSGFTQYFYGAQHEASNSFDHDFAASFSNLTTGSLNGSYHSQVNISGSGFQWDTPTPPSPVPEPESWAMMLGGLALLGAVARRRARK